MCLASIKDKTSKPPALVQSGWKQFDGLLPNLRFPHVAYRGSHNVPLDQWIKAEGDKIGLRGRFTANHYEAGFHIYEDETELRSMTGKRRVYFCRAHTRGSQGGLTTIVAREMYVPSDQDAWPPEEAS